MKGYDYDVAVFALKTTKYVSIEAGLDFIVSKDANDKFLHPFIAMGINEELCRMCFTGKELHYEDNGIDRRGSIVSASK
jgi:hypothetical protein